MDILLFFKKPNLIGLTIISFFIMTAKPFTAHAQINVAFDQRTTPTIFSIKGDFTMIGNTNMTLQSYSDEGVNSNSTMIFVDNDGDANTMNSSSATLAFSTENGAVPANSNIIYAGLYWTGRAHDTISPNTFSYTKGNVTKTFDKSVVYLKHANASAYSTVSATDVGFTQDIYYPTESEEYMYSAYSDVTPYVRQYGLGQYFVADIALSEGNGGATGYYGGWGMIVIYENPLMNWRDVSIYDGHAYVEGGQIISHELPVSGFNTAQSGQINMKLGMMAGEGDRVIAGDYFEIRNHTNTSWIQLTHSSNTATNFFNSSINTGGNERNPNLLNNTGLDIAIFNIQNDNNSVITNNQTSTTFRYGSTQDTYVIFCIAMSVDCSPQLSITKSALEASYTKTGDVLHYDITVTNTGNVTLTNIAISDPLTGLNQSIANLLPGASNAVTLKTNYIVKQADVDAGKVSNTARAAYNYGGESREAVASIEVPVSMTAGLTITKTATEPSFNSIGNILHYTIVVTNTGTVALTNVIVADPLTNLNQTITNLAAGTANAVTIATTYTVTQADLTAGKVDNTVNAAYTYEDKAYEITASKSVPLQQGSELIIPPNTSEIVECFDDIVIPTPPLIRDITGNQIIPVAGQLPLAPSCEGNMIYAWTYTDKTGKNYIWTHTATIKYKPFAPISPTFSTIKCVKDIWDGILPSLPVVTDNCGNILTPTGPVKSTLPKCQGTKTWTWTYTDCAGNTRQYVHTVDVINLPLAPIPPTSSTFECTNSFVEPQPPLVKDNCGNILTPVGPVKTILPSCEGNKTWTWTYTDCSGNMQDYVHTMYFKRTTYPSEDGKTTSNSSTVGCVDEAVAPTLPVIKDVCGNILAPGVPVRGDSNNGCEGTSTYTFTYSDCAGLKFDWTYTYIIRDNISPEIILDAGKSEYIIEGCNLNFRIPVPTTRDNCNGNVSLSALVDDVSISIADLSAYKFEKSGTTKVTFTATDVCGNSSTSVVTVNRKPCTTGKSGDLSDIALIIYPNPFVEEVKFEIKSLDDTHIRIDIFTPVGTLIDVVIDEDINQGDVRTVEFDATAYPQSAYLYRVTTNATLLNGIILKTR